MGCACGEIIGLTLGMAEDVGSRSLDANFATTSYSILNLANYGFCIDSLSALLENVPQGTDIPGDVISILGALSKVFHQILEVSLAGGFIQTRDDDVWIRDPPYDDLSNLPATSGNGYAQRDPRFTYDATGPMAAIGASIVSAFWDVYNFPCGKVCDGVAPFMQIHGVFLKSWYKYTFDGQTVKTEIDMNALDHLLGIESRWPLAKHITTLTPFNQVICTGVTDKDFAPLLDCCKTQNKNLLDRLQKMTEKV